MKTKGEIPAFSMKVIENYRSFYPEVSKQALFFPKMVITLWITKGRNLRLKTQAVEAKDDTGVPQVSEPFFSLSSPVYVHQETYT